MLIFNFLLKISFGQRLADLLNSKIFDLAGKNNLC
jgi:hypothetical protein